MSLLSSVERAIKARKAEQAEIHERIQFYRAILQAVLPQPKFGLEESDSAGDVAADTGASPGEKEDIELLERALEKALRVRTGGGPSKKAPKEASQKKTHATVVTIKEGMQASAASKVNQSSRSTSNSSSIGRTERIHRNAGILHHQAARKSQPAVSAIGSVAPSQLHASDLNPKQKKNTVLSVSDRGKAASVSVPTSNNTGPASCTGEPGAPSLPQQNRIASEQIAKWRSLRRKKNRFWDNVVAVQRKPEPGRSRFMERMRATFPEDWPCGSPDQTRALLNRLTHQGHDLAQRCQMNELLDKQTPDAATELGAETPEGLQIKAAELQHFADKVKREWEAWDRWRPDGGCICPSGSKSEWEDGLAAALPPTITYTTQAELQQLENLRTRVALLQQELYIEQTLLDTLSPQLSSMVLGPGRPNISVLRHIYSLLAEGGQRFPAIVLDSEPD